MLYLTIFINHHNNYIHFCTMRGHIVLEYEELRRSIDFSNNNNLIARDGIYVEQLILTLPIICDDI